MPSMRTRRCGTSRALRGCLPTWFAASSPSPGTGGKATTAQTSRPGVALDRRPQVFVVRSSVTSGYQSGRHRDYGVTVYGRAVVGVVSLAGNGRGGQAGQLQVPRTRRPAALMVQAMHSRRPSKINAAPEPPGTTFSPPRARHRLIG